MGRSRRVAVTVEQCWHRVPGGTATSTLGLLRALVARDDVELVGVAARHHEAPPPAFVPPIEVRHLPVPRLAMYETWHALRWPKVEFATGRVDLVHGTAVAVPPSDAPLVMTIHDLAFLADPTQPTRHGLRFFRRGTDLARRRAARVLVPSEATRQECLDAGFAEDLLRIVPWGVDPVAAADVDEAKVAEARARHGLDRPYVLFVGTVEPRKNLAGVVAAAAALDGRGVDLVLVGPSGWNEDLDAKVRALQGTDVRVHRLGFLAPADLAPLYAGCAAFCFPSLREGFGMPVLEAMAAGAPVVTSSGTATQEVAGDAALVVAPEDHEAIGAALCRLVDDSNLAADLRARGRARAATYTWERTAALTVAAYDEVVP